MEEKSSIKFNEYYKNSKIIVYENKDRFFIFDIFRNIFKTSYKKELFKNLLDEKQVFNEHTKEKI